jgi:hypothetical protein
MVGVAVLLVLASDAGTSAETDCSTGGGASLTRQASHNNMIEKEKITNKTMRLVSINSFILNNSLKIDQGTGS